jgi:hypothetical protein
VIDDIDDELLLKMLSHAEWVQREEKKRVAASKDAALKRREAKRQDVKKAGGLELWRERNRLQDEAKKHWKRYEKLQEKEKELFSALQGWRSEPNRLKQRQVHSENPPRTDQQVRSIELARRHRHEIKMNDLMNKLNDIILQKQALMNEVNTP